MKIKRLAWVAAVAGASLGGFSAYAQDAGTPDVQALLKRIDELEQKVKILDRNRELDKESDKEKAKTTPVLSVGENGFSFRSADTNFVFKLKGLIQADSRTFLQDAPNSVGNNGFLLRRLRPIFEGTVYRDFDFLFVTEFGGNTTTAGNIVDAYVNYRYEPELQLRVGRFKPPVGLELLQADAVTAFNERALPPTLVPQRDLGAMLHGEVFDNVFAYQLAILNGVGDNQNPAVTANDVDDNKSFAARVFVHPFLKTDITALQQLGVGLAGTYATDQRFGAFATQGPKYVSDGQQSIFTFNGSPVAGGDHWRLSPQAYYYWGPFSLLGEYVISNEELRKTVAQKFSTDYQNSAYALTAGYVLTGEDVSYKTGVIPREAFDPSNGHWGAWQLVARFEGIDFDNNLFRDGYATATQSPTSADAWSVGLNWWLNRNVRINTSFSHTEFHAQGSASLKKATNPVVRQPENVLFTRVQLAF